MRRLLILSCNLFCILLGALAQNDSIEHSKSLKEFVVYTDMKKYQAGAKIESITSEQLAQASQAGLDQALMRFTPIYIKSNAGGLSTIRLRGTSANHTAINFGGINVNSLTLGHSNMSSMPVYLFDGISLQFGSASAVNGSGAIGGAVNLGLNSNWTDGLKITANTTQGSFGEQMYGAKIFVGNGKFESVTRAFYYKKENNFSYTSSTWNFDSQSYQKDTQRNARIENMGLLQEINYRLAEKITWKNALWLENDWHEIQQNMATNFYNPQKIEKLEDQNIRLWSEFKHEAGKIKYRLAGGYVSDHQIYNTDNIQTIGAERLISELEISQDIKRNFGYKLGTNQKIMIPHVYSYSDSLISSEIQSDYYFSAYYIALKRIKFSLNLRQMFVSNFDVPFTPSLGMELRIVDREKNSLKLLSNVSRSYRIPTFNDRFWGTQGNPNLKPENGMNYEAGLNYAYCSKRFQWETKLNAFYMNVNNWIEWRPGAIDWTARNVMEVESKGVEFSQNIVCRFGKSELNVRGNFSLNNVVALQDISESSSIGQQLVYTPRQMGNAYLSWKYRGWMLFADGSYTGIRNHDYTGDKLPFYYILNMGIKKIFKLKNHQANINISCLNLFDQSYQNEMYYAMPGRNFNLGLSIDLNYLKTKFL